MLVMFFTTRLLPPSLYFSGEQSYKVVIKQDGGPTTYAIINGTVEQVELTHSVVDYVNSTLQYNKIIKSEGLAQIYIVFSDGSASDFNHKLKLVYHLVFGEKNTQKADDFGVFNMTKSKVHPCRALALFAPDIWDPEGVNYGESRHKVQVLDIGSFSFAKECLVEELGHALFHVPDRWSVFAKETIFNSQAQKDPISVFSSSDVHLIKFLDSNFVQHGMNEYQLWIAYSKYLVSLFH